jgi:hypothetical protein
LDNYTIINSGGIPCVDIEYKCKRCYDTGYVQVHGIFTQKRCPNKCDTKTAVGRFIDVNKI